MSIRRLSFAILFLASACAWAGPAPWYWWVSKLDGSRVCAQITLGQGWVREPIAYKDARCQIRLEPR